MERSTDHNEHCKGWRFELYLQDIQRRMAIVDDRANLTSQQRADIELAHWQLLQVRA